MTEKTKERIKWTLELIERHPRYRALSLRKQALLSYRYGGGSVEQAAKLFGVERAEVRKIESEALRELERG